jgi:RimJ/RimL family protein N-acetyltransferase
VTSLVEVDDADFDWMLGKAAGRDPRLTLPVGGVDDPATLAHVRGIARGLREGGCRATWMIVSDGEVVGLCGYKEPPKGGLVEIGYGIAESRRRRGHATRAVAALLREAERDVGVRLVTAETNLTNIASARVLEKNGFEQTGRRIDPDDGESILWGRAVDAN